MRDYERLVDIAERVETDEARCLRRAAELIERLASWTIKDGLVALNNLRLEARKRHDA